MIIGLLLLGFAAALLLYFMGRGANLKSVLGSIQASRKTFFLLLVVLLGLGLAILTIRSVTNYGNLQGSQVYYETMQKKGFTKNHFGKFEKVILEYTLKPGDALFTDMCRRDSKDLLYTLCVRDDGVYRSVQDLSAEYYKTISKKQERVSFTRDKFLFLDVYGSYSKNVWLTSTETLEVGRVRGLGLTLQKEEAELRKNRLSREDIAKRAPRFLRFKNETSESILFQFYWVKRTEFNNDQNSGQTKFE